MSILTTVNTRRAAVAVCTTVAMAFGLGLATPASAHEQVQQSPPAGIVEPWTPSAGASSDTEAISDAADDFSPADPGSVVALADAASADEASHIPAIGGDVPVGNGALLEVNTSGATLTSPEGHSIGIAAASQGPGGAAKVVDGVVLTDDVAPSTDLVTRATDSSVQLVAVLADDSAPERVDFNLDLPAGAVLSRSADGSVAVTVPTETVVFDPAASARFDAQVAAIIGSTKSLDEVTAKQWAQIDRLAPVSGRSKTVQEKVAVISAPWAVDANGTPVETSYEIHGNTLTQVVATDASTAYPVVADPSLAFLWQAAKCVGQLGLMALAVAKAASMVVKLVKYVSGLNKASKVAKAWSQLVGKGSTVDGFKKLANALGSLLKKLTTDGLDAMKKHATTTVTLTAAFTVLTYAGDAIAEIIGIDECVDLVLGRY